MYKSDYVEGDILLLNNERVVIYLGKILAFDISVIDSPYHFEGFGYLTYNDIDLESVYPFLNYHTSSHVFDSDILDIKSMKISSFKSVIGHIDVSSIDGIVYKFQGIKKYSINDYINLFLQIRLVGDDKDIW